MVQIASCKVLKDCYMQRRPDFRFHRRKGTTNLSLHLHGNLTSTRALSTEVSELVRLPRLIASAPRDCHTEKLITTRLEYGLHDEKSGAPPLNATDMQVGTSSKPRNEFCNAMWIFSLSSDRDLARTKGLTEVSALRLSTNFNE
jgi:hypothetical protein